VSRTRTVAGLLLVASALGAGLAWRWPSSKSAVDCAGPVHLDLAGVATCGVGERLPAGQAHSVRQRSDLNRASVADLALLAGVSQTLAQAIVDERTRLGRFTDWAQVDAIDGVGPARLALLQADFALDSDDAGLW
jgi:hypothetical protein